MTDTAMDRDTTLGKESAPRKTAEGRTGNEAMSQDALPDSVTVLTDGQAHPPADTKAAPVPEEAEAVADLGAADENDTTRENEEACDEDPCDEQPSEADSRDEVPFDAGFEEAQLEEDPLDGMSGEIAEGTVSRPGTDVSGSCDTGTDRTEEGLFPSPDDGTDAREDGDNAAFANEHPGNGSAEDSLRSSRCAAGAYGETQACALPDVAARTGAEETAFGVCPDGGNGGRAVGNLEKSDVAMGEVFEGKKGKRIAGAEEKVKSEEGSSGFGVRKKFANISINVSHNIWGRPTTSNAEPVSGADTATGSESATRHPGRSPLSSVTLDAPQRSKQLLLVHLAWERRDETMTRADMAARARELACGDVRQARAARLVLGKGRFGLALPSGEGALPSGWSRGLSLAALLTRLLHTGIEVHALRLATGERVWWVWAARDGWLSVRADCSLTAFADAMAHARALADSLGCDDVRHYDEQASQARLARLVQQAAREDIRASQLVPLEPLSLARLAKFTCLAALAVGLVAGGRALWIWQRDSAEGLAILQSQSRLEQQILDVRRHPERYFASAWLGAPKARDVIAAYVPLLLEHPLSGNGWRLETLKMQARTTGSHARPAFAGHLQGTWQAARSASLLHPPHGTSLVSGKPTRATGTRPLPALQTVPRDPLAALEGLYEEKAMLQRLYAFTTRFGLRLRVNWKPVETRRIGEKTVMQAPWRAGSVRWSQVPGAMVADWPSLAGALDLPGLELTGMVWTASTGGAGRWEIEGTVHVRR